MLHIINAEGTINNESETHYAVHDQIDSTQYPQVHDFYELTFIASGKLKYQLCRSLHILEEGSLVFVRPGDIHSKVSIGSCRHINLAFPCKALDALFDFLYAEHVKTTFLEMPYVPIVSLNHNDKMHLESRLMKLAYFPINDENRIKTYLRAQLMHIFSHYIIPVASTSDQIVQSDSVLPTWLEESILALQSSGSYENSLDWIVKRSGRSKEHICRCFRKYMHRTPSEVINHMRLNYAANLLAHTDKEIIDIIYEIGFKSVSYFYNRFKREFGMTPKAYREKVFYN